MALFRDDNRRTLTIWRIQCALTSLPHHEYHDFFCVWSEGCRAVEVIPVFIHKHYTCGDGVWESETQPDTVKEIEQLSFFEVRCDHARVFL